MVVMMVVVVMMVTVPPDHDPEPRAAPPMVMMVVMMVVMAELRELDIGLGGRWSAFVQDPQHRGRIRNRLQQVGVGIDL
jgi:hypothetical protein